jgi:hypothetical protein
MSKQNTDQCILSRSCTTALQRFSRKPFTTAGFELESSVSDADSMTKWGPKAMMMLSTYLCNYLDSKLRRPTTGSPTTTDGKSTFQKAYSCQRGPKRKLVGCRCNQLKDCAHWHKGLFTRNKNLVSYNIMQKCHPTVKNRLPIRLHSVLRQK